MPVAEALAVEGEEVLLAAVFAPPQAAGTGAGESGTVSQCAIAGVKGH